MNRAEPYRRFSETAFEAPMCGNVYKLLPLQFTTGELREVYETILHRTLDQRNFRKQILVLGFLKQLRKKCRSTHRTAAF